MAPTKVEEEVLDLVIPYIYNVEDQNSVSLVSHKFYEIDSRLSKRFPFIESLTLKGPPFGFNQRYHYDMPITPWIQQLALEFRCLKELHIHGLAINDEDLEILARTHGFSVHLASSTYRGFLIETGDSTVMVSLGDISNEALEGVGTHLKNMRDCRIWLGKEDGISDLPLDNGVRAMLMGCKKLEWLDISLCYEGLTDVGLEYIRKYGANLWFLSLTCIGNSNAGLVKLSEGCPRLRKLRLRCCPFSKQAVTSSVFNIPTLRKEQAEKEVSNKRRNIRRMVEVEMSKMKSKHKGKKSLR
ncbi:nucleosome assembly protein 1,4 [Tanacetum coccineum]|uniref:Nucleosome assembly protein 1,4 n=1 Tax=Tanacetum coccineum TaxID=301880 RepID=A0ABQ5BJE5_9ASTR